MNRFIVFIIFASSFIIGYSQRTSKVSATYTYYAPETMSIEEAKRVALDRAKIQAIADEFGTIVSQSTTTVITNKNGESNTQFFALGGSDVKGEWIETIGNPDYQLQFENHFLVVRCTVKGKAREIESTKIEIIAKPLRNGTTLRYESNEFKDGDDLYLYFKTPEDGYISIYLLDESTQLLYNILPYKNQPIPSVKVKGTTESIFFSKDHSESIEKSIIDEYTLSCDNDKEINVLYVVFSNVEIKRPTSLISSDPSKPISIQYKDFRQWLSKNIAQDSTFQYLSIPLSISK
ncbi:MAG: DUF4384 domain-containing protein [Bacteroides sp.]|nr:DUF4384 domain-containing protein [Bacteroides sp.]